MANSRAGIGKLAQALLAGRRRQGADPLAAIAGKYLGYLPLVTALGLAVGLLEGIGTGTLVPLLALVFSQSLPAAIPGPLRAIAQAVAGLDPQQRIFTLGAFLLVLTLLKGLVQLANNLLIATIDASFTRDLLDRLSGRILTVEYPFFLRNDLARLAHIISTDSWSVAEAFRCALAIVPAAAGLVVVSALLMWLEWRLFLIVLIAGLIMQAAHHALGRRQRQLSRAGIDQNVQLHQRMLTILSAMRVIRVFGQQKRELHRFSQASDRVAHNMVAAQRLASLSGPGLDLMLAVTVIVILLLAHALRMPLPLIIAFLVLLLRAQPYAHVISQSRTKIALVGGAMSQVEWLLSQHGAPLALAAGPAPCPIDQPIRFDKVCYSYPDGTQAIRAVDFVIPPGVATAIVGKSGSGKTTLVNLLCKLVEPSSGAIYVGERQLGTISADDWRQNLAIAGQDIDLVDGTVAENIAYGCPHATRADIEEVARAAGADEFLGRLPDGFDTIVSMDGISLSGGQRQRIGIARALLKKPDLLILDEATNAVDAMLETEIMRLLSEHRHFRTALVISHRRSTLAACQAGIVIERGEIIAAGPLNELAYYAAMAGEDE